MFAIAAFGERGINEAPLFELFERNTAESLPRKQNGLTGRNWSYVHLDFVEVAEPEKNPMGIGMMLLVVLVLDSSGITFKHLMSSC